jgi:prepilin-type processing-associated H-X9-DG protein
MPKLPRLLLAALLATVAAPAMDAALGYNAALAAEEHDLVVGTELVATADVALHKADIAKGSHVSVTKLLLSRGQLDGVNVALADGHVVKVTLGTVRTYFQIAQ